MYMSCLICSWAAAVWLWQRKTAGRRTFRCHCAWRRSTPAWQKEYYEAQGRQIEIIRLNGSIELAPILGLSDVIVDIVETGTTLKENDLGVFADVAQSSARLIANKASYQFSAGVIDGICGKLREKL